MSTGIVSGAIPTPGILQAISLLDSKPYRLMTGVYRLRRQDNRIIVRCGYSVDEMKWTNKEYFAVTTANRVMGNERDKRQEIG
jgi:hypothetical protein